MSRVYSLVNSKAKCQSRPGQEATVLSHGTVAQGRFRGLRRTIRQVQMWVDNLWNLCIPHIAHLLIVWHPVIPVIPMIPE